MNGSGGGRERWKVCRLAGLKVGEGGVREEKRGEISHPASAEFEMTRWEESLAGPDAGGEGLDGVEAEILVELDGQPHFEAQCKQRRRCHLIRIRSGFTILEQIREMLMYTRDGPEELRHSRGLAACFVSRQVGGYGVTELSGAADAVSGKQRQHGVRVTLLQLARLRFLGGRCRFADIIHGVAELP